MDKKLTLKFLNIFGKIAHGSGEVGDVLILWHTESWTTPEMRAMSSNSRSSAASLSSWARAGLTAWVVAVSMARDRGSLGVEDEGDDEAVKTKYFGEDENKDHADEELSKGGNGKEKTLGCASSQGEGDNHLTACRGDEL